MSCVCPQCHSKAYKRNGYTRHGKQNHRCLSCGRQFSLEPYQIDMDLIKFENPLDKQISLDKQSSIWSEVILI
jgi:hypothetical protein